MKKVFPALALLILTLTCRAGDKIEGAFGVKLGDAFNPDKATVVKFEGRDGFAFTPEKPNAALSTYMVFVTPNTHLIYEIVALGHGDREYSVKMAQTIKTILHKKYEGADSLNQNSQIMQNGRVVQVIDARPSVTARARQIGNDTAPQSKPPEDYVYSVIYTDSDLQSQAGSEATANYQKELLKNADTTGL